MPDRAMSVLPLLPAVVQQTVDRLAVALGRPAVLEGPELELLTHSAHNMACDDVRKRTIMCRNTIPAVAAWLRSQGVFDAGHAMRVPSCRGLNMLARVCVPIRAATALRGFLWFIDAAESMSDAEIALAEVAASSLVEPLDLLRPPHEQRPNHDRVRELLEPGNAHRMGFPATAGVIALVGAAVAKDGTFLAIRQTPTPIRAWPGLHLRQPDHEVLLLPTSDGRADATTIRHAALLADSIGTRIGGEQVVGVGQARRRLQDASDSVREALNAAKVAAKVPDLGRIVHWSELGIYRLLSHLSDAELSRATAHPRLERLFADPASLQLLRTLEVYLDLGGNVPLAATRLHMHRATLYYRLRRIEELTEADLKNGDDRLCLHTALKLGRLTGRYPGAHSAAELRHDASP
nr:helix-turn-helix domain-containing protein [Kibdelosporangium sp. MJ126-NF4]CEL12905.1 possible transcriptional regulator [Kibdelosporangium sp. MJ126-NF4]CTQ98589.1 possible transcriptional regulator [Kibdelosporangium sp. MJ126-NF4]